MKNIFKKNQMIITALAIMIAVAGYLNYSGSKLSGAKVQTGDDASVTDEASAADDISAEDLYAQTGLEELQFADGDIQSLDSDGEETAEVEEGEEPGEAVLASSSAGTGFAAEAKLSREQLRSKNKETLLEVINNTNISEAQKQEAVDSMVELTDICREGSGGGNPAGSQGLRGRGGQHHRRARPMWWLIWKMWTTRAGPRSRIS